MDALFSDYEAIRKSGLFDPEYYLATYPDVAERNLDPLVHYLEEGAQQGRNPNPAFDGEFYLEQCRQRGEQPNNPLLHYLRVGAARGFKTRRDETDGRPRAATRSRERSRDKADRSPILLAIESLGVLGGPDGSSRLSVSGWALAEAPIAEITATLNGKLVGTAHYGFARPDVAGLYPNRDGAAHSGFILAVDLPTRQRGALEPLLTVRTTEDEIGQRRLPVEIPPQEVDIGVADPLDPAGGAAPHAGKPAMQLHIDSATVDRSGILRVEGWVLCLVQLEAVEAFIDDARIGEAEFGRVRADIETAHPVYPNSRFSGFTLAADIGSSGAGRKTVLIRATARAGISGEATARVEIPRRTAPSALHKPGFECHWDEIALTPAGRLVVKGWAVAAAPTASIVVLLDGEEIGPAEIALERADVGNRFPALAHARRSGFALDMRVDKPIVGKRLVTIRVCLTTGQIHQQEFPVAASGGGLSSIWQIAGDADRMLQLDTPQAIDGVVEMPVRGNLEISGWALARAGVAAIEIALDGVPTALASCGLRRLDIRSAFPEWSGALTSGFSTLLPHRILPAGPHTVSVTLRDKAGRTAGLEFRIEVEEPPETAGPWSLRRRIVPAEADLARRILERRDWHPTFMAMLPVQDDRESLRRARTTIASLCAQAYPDWRLLIVPQGRSSKSGAALLAEMAEAGEQSEVLREVTPATLRGLAARIGIPAAEMFFTVLTPGDQLGCDAFLEMALASAVHRGADFLYSDERRMNPASGVVEAFFKPQWSPDLMLSTNYVGRLWCARADLLGSVAPATEPLLGYGEYDLVLRCTERAAAVRHVPAVLCERAPEAAEHSREAKAALQRMLARRDIAGEIGDGPVPGSYHVKRRLTRPGLVSIIIPTCAAQGMIETCIGSLRRLTGYRDYEIVCIENIAPKDRKWRAWLRRNADRVISTKEAFNWSRFNNLAAAEAKGEYLLFLNDDVEIIAPDWLDNLLEHAQRPEIGVVGPRLLYPDRRVQHAGMFLAAMGQARHAFRYAAEDSPGYFGLALTERNVIAVTGACLLTRRDTFDALGGFDEAQAIINNDIDYCLRAWQSGLLNLYTPHATLIHHEAASRAALDDVYDAAAFDRKWRNLFLAGDPFFHPHLSKNHDEVTVEHEPTELFVSGRPSLRRADIRNILVLKLDHIGDCIIAFPAVRRLKQHFPEARITVLTAQGSLPLWELEPSVDRTIAFDFFHARSALGELDRSDEDWRELRERLSPERFDLAIDLRKHIETRPVLQHTGARYLAGFDFRNQFPWLDFSLEWSGDQIYARKRQHNGDDLVNLVDAVAAACEADAAVIAAPPSGASLAAMLRGDDPAAGPLVCVHPTAGNDMKQWPVEYFAAVIDRLVADDRARIVLIGAPGEEAVAAALLDQLRQREAVTSLVGKVTLTDLPSLIAGMALFLGNDSGPKHIAAALGVPTVGVHAGTVDVREWGPVGPAAISVARSVVCSPCYLSKVEDCRRGLVCLRQLQPGQVYAACKRLLLLAAPAQPAPRAVTDQRHAAGIKPRRPRRAASAAAEIRP